MAGSVLLIDDDVDVLRSIGNYFERLGYEVTRELSGEAGLATFDRLRPEVVILDLRLPGDGRPGGARAPAPAGRRRHPAHRARATSPPRSGPCSSAPRTSSPSRSTWSTWPRPPPAWPTRPGSGGSTRRCWGRAPPGHGLDSLGTSSGDAGLRSSGGAPGAERADHGAAHGRERHRQGLGGADDPRPEPARPRPRSSRSTAPGSTPPSSTPSSSVTRRERSPTRRTASRGCSRSPTSGTIFLDEIGDLPPELQPKLLKVLETKTFRRLGGTREITVDVRLIAATNKDLQAEVESGALPGGSLLPAERHAAAARRRCATARARTGCALITRLLTDLRSELPDGPPTLSGEVLDRLLAYRLARQRAGDAQCAGAGAHSRPGRARGERRAPARGVPRPARHRRPAPHAAQPRRPRAPAHRAHAQAPYGQPDPRRHRARDLARDADQQDQALHRSPPEIAMAEITRARRHGLPGLRPRGAGLRGLSLRQVRHVHLPDLHLSRRDALPRVRRQGRAAPS